MRIRTPYQKTRNLIRRSWLRLRARESAIPDTQFYSAQVREKYSFAIRFLPKRGLLVDAACGTGLGIANSGQHQRYVGLDKNRAAIILGEEYHPELKGKLRLGNVTKMPFPSQSVSGLTAFEVFEHLRRKQKVKFLDEVKRVLAPEGVFVMSTPFKFGPLTTLNINHFGKEVTLEELAPMLHSHFSNVRYFGQGEVSEKLSGKLAARVLELITSVDLFYLRRLVVSRERRSKAFQSLMKTNEILPIETYLSSGKLPKTIIAIAN